MPIFEINRQNKIRQIISNINYFKKESDLRDFFAENLGDLLGMKFLEVEYPTNDGRIDTLALDENNCPVIIEYKWDEDNAIFVQGLFYFHWLKKNKPHFNLLVANKLGKELSDRINWNSPRVILIARGFDNRTMAAVQQVNNVELIKYMPYENNILYLETVYSPSKNKVVAVAKNKIESAKNENFGVNYHLDSNHCTEEVRNIFYKFQELIKSLPDVQEVSEQKSGITYRTTKSFTRLEFGKSFIKVLLKDPKYFDPKNLVKDITSFGYGYKGQTKIRSDRDISDIFSLIKQSYQSTI